MEITKDGKTYPVIDLVTQIIEARGGTFTRVCLGTSAEAVSTGDGGNVQQRLNLLERAITGQTTCHIVETIQKRDELGANTGDTAFVKDASGDPTVEKGSASYIREADGTWFKTGERESMDVILEWDAIEGKPVSKPAEIDLAVGARHRHDNAETLAKLSEQKGKLAFDGQLVNPDKRWIVKAARIDDVDTATLADPCLVILEEAISCDCSCEGCENGEAQGPATYLYSNGEFELLDMGSGNGLSISASAFSIDEDGYLCVDDAQVGDVAFRITENGFLEASNG